jgi:branched-subunit amino acid aminotransferase/4-amino-4-deoxychorismate lyase
MRVIIDGVEVDDASASISIYDWGVLRGFGVFEVIRAYGGVPFRLEPHLDRLERSAAALGIRLPDRNDLAEWSARCAAAGGDCYVRIVVTEGSRDPLFEAPGRTIVLWDPLAQVPPRLSLLPMKALWHPATDAGGFSGIKWISYAPNMASTDKAHAAGFDDALLLTADGIVIEGPTFTVAWTTDGRLETPTLELGILASITRDVMIEAAHRLGVEVHQGAYPLERLLEADEAFALSTIKEVTPIERVGEHEIAVGDFGKSFAAEFEAIVAAETAGSSF